MWLDDVMFDFSDLLSRAVRDKCPYPYQNDQ